MGINAELIRTLLNTVLSDMACYNVHVTDFLRLMAGERSDEGCPGNVAEQSPCRAIRTSQVVPSSLGTGDALSQVQQAIRTLQQHAPEQLTMNHLLGTSPSYEDLYSLPETMLQSASSLTSTSLSPQEEGLSSLPEVMLQSSSSFTSGLSSSSDLSFLSSGQWNVPFTNNNAFQSNDIDCTSLRPRTRHISLEWDDLFTTVPATATDSEEPLVGEKSPSTVVPAVPEAELESMLSRTSSSGTRKKRKKRHKGPSPESLAKRRKHHIIAERRRRDQFRELCSRLRECITEVCSKRGKVLPAKAMTSQQTVLGKAVEIAKMLKKELDDAVARERLLDRQLEEHKHRLKRRRLESLVTSHVEVPGNIASSRRNQLDSGRRWSLI